MIKQFDVVLFGGGPANLMTASFLVNKGLKIALFEQNAQLGKKILIAGKSGLNLSMNTSIDQFSSSYYTSHSFITPILESFTPEEQRQYFKTKLGLETYIGSAGKVFPKETAVVFLKTWLSYLKTNKLEIFTRCKWQGFNNGIHEVLDIKSKQVVQIKAKYTVFGFGGQSWKETGSDGNWITPFNKLKIDINNFEPSNSGLKCKFDDYFFDKWNGHFMKNIRLNYGEKEFTGEIRIGDKQLEGSPIYHLNAFIRNDLKKNKPVVLYLDLKPQMQINDLKLKWNSKLSVNKNCKNLRVSTIFSSLYKMLNTDKHPVDFIKSFPIEITGFEDMDKAISSYGGVSLNQLNKNLSLKTNNSWYVNGEMLSWDAPTGGYLLSACFALGKEIANSIKR